MLQDGAGCRAEAADAAEDIGVNPSAATPLGDIIRSRLGRRGVLRGLLGSAALAGAGAPGALLAGIALPSVPGVSFTEIGHGIDDTHHVAPGYRAEVLIRWGDPVLSDAPAFDPLRQTAAAQQRQFGYNNDYIGFLPLPAEAALPERGLLCINHEYTIGELMFPDAPVRPAAEFTVPGVAVGPDAPAAARARVAIEMAAHGCSIVEVERDAAGRWRVAPGGQRNRRITAETPMRLSGPAAGHPRLRTTADSTGTQVLGTLNNCAGGVTPWGTYLTAEENINGYFGGSLDGHPDEAALRRYGIPGRWYDWHMLHDRFDIRKEPHEPNRFGWIVEIDPFDPASTPVKRTALGRFKHEGAASIVNGDGRVVFYSGDDERHEYLYRFVTRDRLDPVRRDANHDLLDHGTLSVARFAADGTVHWLPLVFGAGGLVPANGFHSQADVLIEARRAGDVLGATPMDRPEDVEPCPVTGKVYVMLTNNARRAADSADAANPRAPNEFGHILEITPGGGDHAAATARWDILVKCGDPARPELAALWNERTSPDGWFASPDNCAVDHRGRLWVTTDQGEAWPKSGTADGIWFLATEGEERGTGRMFFRAPVGAEVCGPCFTPDDRALFVSVQHPAADGVKDYPPFLRYSTFADPATRWPDFQDGMPPRPAVMVITRDDGGVVGG